MSHPRRKADRITKTLSLSSELAQWAEREAAKENRSLSNYIETFLANLKRKKVEADKQLHLGGIGV